MKRDRYEAVQRICARFGIYGLYAFGSRSGEVRSWLEGLVDRLGKGGSDVDLGIKGGPRREWTVKEKVLMGMAFEDLLDCSRVDVVVLEEADAFLAAEVVRGERLYARDEHAADEYELYVLRRAGDLAPLERERQKLVLERTL